MLNTFKNWLIVRLMRSTRLHVGPIYECMKQVSRGEMEHYVKMFYDFQKPP